MLNLLINLAGLLLIAVIVWWFWLSPRAKKSPQVQSGETLEILVKDGVYQPNRIQLPAGRAAILRFRREDAGPCAEYVLFPDLEVSAQLTVNRETAVQIPPSEPGEYPFTCQMQMYRGVLELV